MKKNHSSFMKETVLHFTAVLSASAIALSGIAAVPVTGGFATVAEAATSVSYNANRAVDYALGHSCSHGGTCGCRYDHDHVNYNPWGGDCANFVSSCLMMGNLPTDSEFYTYYQGNKIAGSRTFINADLLLDYFKKQSCYSNLVRMSPSKSEIKPGNPVWTSYDGGHVMICTGINSAGTPLLTGHNNDRYNLPVSGGYYATVRLDLLESMGESSGQSTSGLSRNLYYGAQGDDVRKVQEYLEYLGYDCGSCGADGIIGNDTVSAIRAFQQDSQLEVDGIVGPLTFKALLAKVDAMKSKQAGNNNSSGLTRMLSYGAEGEDVRRIQQMLMDKGYYLGNGGADGLFYSDTQAAVRKYQQDHGLEVDGIVGPETFASLNAVEANAIAVDSETVVISIPNTNTLIAQAIPIATVPDVEPLEKLAAIVNPANIIMLTSSGHKDDSANTKKSTSPKLCNPYTDVKSGKYYENAVLFLLDKGVMTGFNKTTFGVGKNLTREDMVTLLWKAEGCPKSKTNASFKDVPAGKYYSTAISWAKENKIVSGFTDTTFGKGRNITRQDFVKILYGYAAYKGYATKVNNANAYKKKADAGYVSSYAVKAVNWGYSKGLIGVGSNLEPQKDITRQDAAVIIARFLQKYE